MKSKDTKRIEAEIRQDEHNKLTTVEKLEKCLNRSGKAFSADQGREAKKLYKQLAKERGIKGDYETLVLPPYVRAKE